MCVRGSFSTVSQSVCVCGSVGFIVSSACLCVTRESHSLARTLTIDYNDSGRDLNLQPQICEANNLDSITL